MLKKITFIIIIFTTVSFSQSREVLDSLFNRFVEIKQHQHIDEEEQIKCGFGIVNSVRTNIEQFTQAQQQILLPLFQREPKEKSIVSPSGFFRIHYDLSGTDVPRYLNNLTADENAFLVAEALDSTFNFEVNYLGYLSPPPDNGKGGDNLYDVYISNTGSNLYGYTQFEDETSPGSRKFSSYMVIDNDFAGFYSSGVNGARVTVAHEFHHAIQGGSYIYRDTDIYYYEITSTAMEEFVFDSINDYYGYLHEYFGNPYLALTEHLGYDLAIFNIFLENRFDHGLLKRIWELMIQNDALNAINRALIEKESSFDIEYNLFGVWTYFTGYRTTEGYFEEAENYPLISPLQVIEFNPPSYGVNGSSRPTGNNYIFFINDFDTLVALISNSDINSANSNPSLTQSYTYQLYNYEASGSIKLTDDYYMSFQAERPNFWRTSEILNNQVVKDGVTPPISAYFAFPSPFHYSKNYQGAGSFIIIPLEQNKYGSVEFSVYTSGMDRVYWNIEPIRFKSNFYFVQWNGLNNDNNKLATGVYLYIIKSGDDVIKGKIVIFND